MMQENMSIATLSPPAPETLFIYKVTPDQVNTSTDTNHPITLNVGIYNPKANGAVACSTIEFGISIGDTENSLTTDPTDIEGQSSQSTWTLQKQAWTKGQPLIFKVEPATGTTGLNAGEAISFQLTGINVNDVVGPAVIQIAEVTNETRQTQQLVNKASPALQITSFQADPPSIHPNSSTKLSWETTGASHCTLTELSNSLCSPPDAPPYWSPPDPALGLEPNGQVTVCPQETTTYTLTAYESDGGYREQQFIVAVGQATIISFWPEPFKDAIDCTTPQVTINWEVQNAGKVMLSWDPGNLDGTDVTGLDYLIVTPAVNTEYTLLADGAPPATPQSFSINIEPASITSFTATPAGFVRGQPVTLAWETKYACTCSIDQGVGTVTPASSGSVVVNPQELTTYTLTASGMQQPATQSSGAVTPQPSGWQQTTSTGPSAAFGLGFNNLLWMIDAENGNVWSSPDGASWTLVTNAVPFKGYLGCGGAAFDDGKGEKMWVTGGNFNGSDMNNVWSSTDGVTWTKVATSSIWPGRSGHSCLVFKSKLWVMGGFQLNDVWSSPDGVNWTEAKSSPPWGARWSFGAAAFNPAMPSGINQMWICGGTNSGDVLLQDAWYTDDGETWTQAPAPQWSPRIPAALLMLNSKLYLIGWNCQNVNYCTDMWMMDSSMNWTQAPDQVPQFPGMRLFPPACVVFDWQIFMTQGASFSVTNGMTYRYAP